MGIMHKLLKRRDIERQQLLMDLTQFKDTNINQVNLTENKDLSEVDLVPKLATEDNQFTAEHIMQLCKFLAEKSKRNKTTNKRLLSSPNKCKNEIQNQRESNMNNMSLEAESFSTHLNCKATSFNVADLSKAQILTNRFENTNSNIVENLQNINNLDLNKLQNSQGSKRDILLKIRQQIFERKRQRELEEQQGMDVWRPW